MKFADKMKLVFVEEDDYSSDHAELQLQVDDEDCPEGKVCDLWLDGADGEKILIVRREGQWSLSIWPEEHNDTHLTIPVNKSLVARRHWEGDAESVPFGLDIDVKNKGGVMRRLLKWLLGLCNHDDGVRDTIYLKSPAIANRELMLAAADGRAVDIDVATVPRWYHQSCVVTVIRCKKCGRVKHVRTKCP